MTLLCQEPICKIIVHYLIFLDEIVIILDLCIEINEFFLKLKFVNS